MYRLLLAIATLLPATSAGPIPLSDAVRRAVTELDPDATAEAHPRDDTATRAFAGTQIKVLRQFVPFLDIGYAND